MDSRPSAAARELWAETTDQGALRRYKELVDLIDDGIYQLSPDGTIVAVNDVLLELTGRDHETLLGDHISALLAEDGVELLETQVEKDSNANGETETFESYLQTASGRLIPCKLRVKPLRTNGALDGSIGIVRDLSLRKPPATVQLGEAVEDTLGTIVEKIDGGIFVIDDDCEVVWVNETIGEYFGLDPTELVGHDSQAVLREIVSERVTEPVDFSDRVLASYEHNNSIEEFACRIENGSDDGVRWLNHWSKPIESGDLAGGRIEIYTDITDERETAAALAETEERFQMLVDTVSEYAIFRLDPEGRVRSWNRGAEEIKGYDKAEIIGEHVSTFYTESEREAGVPEQNLRAATRHGSTEDEGWRVRKDGSRFWASVTITALQDEDGVHQGYLKVTHDMTDRHRREAKLESELERILDRISDAFYALDEDFKFTHINDRAEELLQSPREELLGETVWEQFPDAKETIVWDEFHKALQTQEAVSFDIEYEPLDIWVEVNAYPSGTGLSVYFRDITERMAKRREIQQREQELQAYREYTDRIFGAIDDIFYVVDTQGKFQRWNDALEEVTGYSESEIATMGPADFIIQEDKEKLLDGVQQVFETGNARVQATIACKGGDRIPMEFAASAVETPDGKQVLTGIGRNITDRRKRERALEESRSRYKALVENFPDTVVGLFDDNLEYTTIGGEMVDQVNVPVKNRVGHTIDEIYPQEMVEKIKPYYEAALRGESGSFDLEFRNRQFHVRTLPIESEEEVFAGMVVAQDVTERREDKRQLEESNERLEQFAHAASHDLQEPLRMVSSYLRLVKRRYGDRLDEDGREFLDFAVNGADRMREMIERLLEYSRIESRGAPLKPVELGDVLSDVRKSLRLTIEEHDAEITAESLPRVRGDESQLRQLFQNLLDNAIQYSGDAPPRVHISAEPCDEGTELDWLDEEEFWVISVEDDGIGIDPENSERIFQVFQSLAESDEHSSGIGLALCKRIVERHGGDICVASEPGDGATFTFSLPVANDTNV